MTVPDGAPHLTEAERQGAADGTLSEARRRYVADHLAACADCDADVARLRRFVARARASRPPAAPLDALWPDIRARIERDKVVALVPARAPSSPSSPRPGRRTWLAGLAAAGLAAAAAVAIAVRASRPAATAARGDARVGDATGAVAGDALVTPAADSSRAYEQEVQALLNEMALRRALIRPDVAARMDRDIRVIDSAIAELEDALRHDPNNPALRQLLAASYRQKRDLLKRVDDAS